MFKTSKKIVSRKSLVRKVSSFLTSNFFTIEEFNSLSARESKKVVKYLAKIQGVKLSRTERVEVINFINNINKPKAYKGALKLFTNIKKHFEVKSQQVVSYLITFVEKALNPFLNRIQIIRC